MLSRLFRSPRPETAEERIPADEGTPPALSGTAGPGAPLHEPERDAPDRALLDALKESRQRFKDIVEVSGDFAWETDAAGQFVFVSPGVTLGYVPDDLVGKPARRFLADLGIGRDSPFATRDAVRDVDIWLRTADGKGSACLRTSAMPILDGDGNWRGARGVCRDVTEERRAHAAFVSLQVREALMARIVRAAGSALEPEDMLETALSETRNALSALHADLRRPAADGAFGIVAVVADDAGEDPPVLATVFARMAEGRSMVTAADGERFYLCAPVLFRDEVTAAILVARDLDGGAWTDDERSFSEELAAQFAVMLAQIDSRRQLEEMARNDELTGLLNRRAFIGDLQDRLARVAGGGASGAMFYVDFDNFKLVNDVHGHKRGDQALVALADLLTAKTRPGDLVARLGGDEFALWLERTDGASAEARARDLLDASQGLRLFSGAPDRPLGISMGIAVVDSGSGERFQDIAARADAAMYDVKKNGKAGYSIAPAAQPADDAGGGEDGGQAEGPASRASA